MPAIRWSVALGCAAMLVVACGEQAAGGPVIGVRPHTDVSGGTVSFDASSIATEFAAQLAESNSIKSIGENTLANGQLPIDSFLTLRQSLRLAALQTLGNTLVSERLNEIARVRNQVVSDGVMAPSQKGGVIGVLDASTARLIQLRVTIAREQLVDHARIDVVKVATLRVYGLVLPQARMLIAAYQLVRLAAIYASQQASLQQQVYTAQAFGNDVSAAQAAVNDLSVRIANMRQSSGAAVAELLGLSAAGYPGNKPSLVSARSVLGSGQVAGDQAANDALRARAALG